MSNPIYILPRESLLRFTSVVECTLNDIVYDCSYDSENNQFIINNVANGTYNLHIRATDAYEGSFVGDKSFITVSDTNRIFELSFELDELSIDEPVL